MINIAIPSISVEPVTNGYVVQWRREPTKEERKTSSAQYVVMNAVALGEDDLLLIIAVAVKDTNAKDVSDVEVKK